MASSAHKQQQQLPNKYGATAAPPPTPSALSTNSQSTTAATAEALSRLLHRLPPNLSLPTRHFPASSTTTTSPPPPLISLSDPNPNDRLLSSASQLGFFQLSDHDISSQLAQSAELESLSLFELEKDKKESYFPKNWPLGHEAYEEDEDGDGDVNGESFCLDSLCSTESTELNLTSLREFTREMEKVGLKMVEMLASTVGFENPIGQDPTRICSLMWVSQRSHGMDGEKPVLSGGFYPYIVALQYQIRQQKYSLLTNSGRVTVSPQVDSILVTLGDIAQVWSNGKLQKVRGRPCLVPGNAKNNNSQSISMSLLVTLPIDSRVSPMIIIHQVDNNCHEENDEVEEDDQIPGSSSSVKKKKEEKNKLMFESFCFEDYAWRLYHERLLLKDPLDRYRI
ncbi:hypothetical protein Dsin_001053 [Dipteronia sinensis]|uniref:Non-haem dioxygenase N-terminal domain-containing protein n=1 Tax=Dipteronia sinensis TaxID=43782 RepID=A0AAE0B3J9_9ROSI|nr:hypothetical protein Dsin_001053 [Dipteronia sinensis]